MCTTSKPNKSSTSSALHDVLILIIWLVWVRLLWPPQILADLPAGLFPLCLGLCWLFEVLAPLPIGFIFVLVGINSISSVVDSSSMVNSLFVCLECQWTWAVNARNNSSSSLHWRLEFPCHLARQSNSEPIVAPEIFGPVRAFFDTHFHHKIQTLVAGVAVVFSRSVQKENVLWIDPIDFADDGFFCMAVMFVDCPRDQLAIANDSCYTFCPPGGAIG